MTNEESRNGPLPIHFLQILHWRQNQPSLQDMQMKKMEEEYELLSDRSSNGERKVLKWKREKVDGESKRGEENSMSARVMRDCEGL